MYCVGVLRGCCVAQAQEVRMIINMYDDVVLCYDSGYCDSCYGVKDVVYIVDVVTVSCRHGGCDDYGYGDV